jgi:hypothetical protein
MRILVITRSRFPVPRDQIPALMQAFMDWRERYRSVTESFEFFAGGGGGFGVVNVPDEATLNQIMIEYPFADLNEQEIRPILDGDKGLAQWQATLQAMADKPTTG